VVGVIQLPSSGCSCRNAYCLWVCRRAVCRLAFGVGHELIDPLIRPTPPHQIAYPDGRGCRVPCFGVGRMDTAVQGFVDVEGVWTSRLGCAQYCVILL
jgi:hypothetical protein